MVRCPFLILLFATAACAGGTSAPATATTPGSPAPVLGTDLRNRVIEGQQITTLDAPVAKVWAALSAVYDSLGIPVTVIDVKQRSFGNRGFTLRQRLGHVPLSRYIDCGNVGFGPNADSFDIYLTVVTTLRSVSAAQTELVTAVDVAGRPSSLSQPYIKCGSKGELESRIATLAQALIAH